jgi:hypothetical protein
MLLVNLHLVLLSNSFDLVSDFSGLWLISGLDASFLPVDRVHNSMRSVSKLLSNRKRLLNWTVVMDSLVVFSFGFFLVFFSLSRLSNGNCFFNIFSSLWLICGLDTSFLPVVHVHDSMRSVSKLLSNFH